MRRTILKIGALIFFLGIVLFSGSLLVNPNFHGQSARIYPSTEYTMHRNGVYITSIPSNLSSFQESDIMIVVNTSSTPFPDHYALVPQSDISHVGLSNYTRYEVTGRISNNSADIYFDNLAPGSYAFVQTQNSTVAFGVTPTQALDISGYMSFSGGVLAFFGFVVILASLFMRRRDPPFEF